MDIILWKPKKRADGCILDPSEYCQFDSGPSLWITQFKSHSDIFEVELLEAHERGHTPNAFKHFLTR